MIKLYSQPTCGMCKAVHMQLNKKQIPYEEIQDIELMKSKGIQHTPTLEKEDGELLMGTSILDFINNYK